MKSPIPAGTLALIAVVLLLILTPLLMMEAMVLAFHKLGIRPFFGLFIVLAIFAGSLVNIPIKRYRVNQNRDQALAELFGIEKWLPRFAAPENTRILAVNIGGCVIPVMLVIHQLLRMEDLQLLALTALAILVNISACFSLSRFMPGVGIVLPAFFPGVLAAFSALLLVPGGAAPVAFCAGGRR